MGSERTLPYWLISLQLLGLWMCAQAGSGSLPSYSSKPEAWPTVILSRVYRHGMIAKRPSLLFALYFSSGAEPFLLFVGAGAIGDARKQHPLSPARPTVTLSAN